MVNGFASALGPPSPPTCEVIKPVRDVVEAHVREVYEAQKGRMPQYLIAFHLGISPTTLWRMKERWEAGESLARDRR